MASQQISSYCLRYDHVCRINQFVVAEKSEPYGVISRENILSALGQPLQTFGGEPLYATVIDQGGVLMGGLAQAHGFIQGNKRTALMCGSIYLAAHGYILNPRDKLLGLQLVRLVESETTQDTFNLWLSENLIDPNSTT